MFKKRRVAWNKGISPSEELRERISRTLKSKYANGFNGGFQKGHPCYSYNLREWRKIHSPWNKGITGDKSHSFGKIFTEERKRKIAERLKKNQNTKGKSWKQNLTEEQRKSLRERLIGNLIMMPHRGTKIERLLQWLLKKNNIEFKSQYPVLGKYLVDIYVKPNIVIEADGAYWHSSPEALLKDKKRDKELTENGYEIIRFREEEINNNLNDCWNRLKQSLVLTNEDK